MMYTALAFPLLQQLELSSDNTHYCCYVYDYCYCGQAASIHPSRQGSLQGAIFSLRVLTGGITAPAYGALFTLGISDKLHKAVGAHLPGLAFLFGKFLTAATCSSRSGQCYCYCCVEVWCRCFVEVRAVLLHSIVHTSIFEPTNK
jgi:hypothetical protein